MGVAEGAAALSSGSGRSYNGVVTVSVTLSESTASNTAMALKRDTGSVGSLICASGAGPGVSAGVKVLNNTGVLFRATGRQNAVNTALHLLSYQPVFAWAGTATMNITVTNAMGNVSSGAATIVVSPRQPLSGRIMVQYVRIHCRDWM